MKKNAETTIMSDNLLVFNYIHLFKTILTDHIRRRKTDCIAIYGTFHGKCLKKRHIS